jgi:hypothetical protein
MSRRTGIHGFAPLILRPAEESTDHASQQPRPGEVSSTYRNDSSAKVHLRPGTHTIVVDYSGLFGGTAGGKEATVFTYNIKVKADHRSH